MSLNEFPQLLSEDIIKRAEKLNPALLCDGMKGLGILKDGCMEHSIMPVDISMKVVGTAMTVKTDNGDNFPIHVATYACKPGYVMVIDGNNFLDRAYFGDLIMSAAKAVGINGMIVNGMVRDREGCIELGLPVYAKGFMQAGPIKRDPGELNVPIICGGVNVNPGDLIVGGADGVTVVPRDRIEEVLEKAEEKLAYEQEREEVIKAYEEALKNSSQLPQLAPDWVMDMLK